jgi:hypothetical protein
MRPAVASDTFRISITFQLLPCSIEQLGQAIRYGGMGLMATQVACDEGSPKAPFALRDSDPLPAIDLPVPNVMNETPHGRSMHGSGVQDWPTARTYLTPVGRLAQRIPKLSMTSVWPTRYRRNIRKSHLNRRNHLSGRWYKTILP